MNVLRWSFLVGLGSLPQTALQPGQLDARHVALVFNKNSRASGELALYYASRRGLPQNRLIGLDLPMVETLPRDQYEPRVAAPIRAWLGRHRSADPIACLVTFYDVPIRVGAERVTTEMQVALEGVRRQRAAALEEFRQVLTAIDGIASPTTRPTTTSTTTKAVETLEAIRKEYAGALERAFRRTSALTTPEEAALAQRQILLCMERAEGLNGVLPHLRLTGRGDAALGQVQLDRLRWSVQDAQARINALLRGGPLAPGRDEARRLLRRFTGILGLIAHLEEDIQRLKGAETSAAFDSELSTLWSPPAGLYRWRINTLNARDRANPSRRQALEPAEWDAPVLMVSRLDGPSVEVVRRMIDDAISTEKVGLKGHAYLDARGLPASDRPGSYGLYDQNLRDLAGLLSAKTSMPTVLDNRPGLFEIGACPFAALYCGWYSVGRYQDSFRFVRGAVAFHIASNEAVSLRDPNQKYWCKELLAHGAAATLGPVEEPYLGAFPFPRDFFGLLLTGRYALVECYYYTTPYNSWRMLLLGDPLYRPFAVNPLLRLEDALPSDVLPLRPVPTSQPAPPGDS